MVLRYNAGMENWEKILLRLTAVLAIGMLLKFAPYSYHVSQNFRDAQTALAEEDFQAAAENLADAAERLPWRKDLWESAGNFAFRAEDYQLAQFAFEQAAERDTLSQEGQLALGDVYQTLGEDALAEETWTGISGSSVALRRLATLHAQKGNIPATITDWQNALALGQNADETEIHYQLGLLLAAHDTVKAMPHLKAAAPAYPAAQTLVETLAEIPADAEQAYFQIVAGQTLASLNEWNLAEHAFRQAVSLREDYAEAWAYLGEALQHVEVEGGEALAALQNALTLAPNSTSANMFLGIYWQRQGKYEDALPYFEAAGELKPELPEAYIEQARTLAALSKLPEAEEMYRKAIALAPQDAEYYRLLARFCVKYHYQVREVGLLAARQAMLLDGESPASWDVMGLILFDMEDEFNAERLFLRALDVDPRYAVSHLHLGMVYLYQEENSRAFYHLNQAVTFASDPAVEEHAQHLLGYFSP